MMFVVPTNEPIKRKCLKCGKNFIQRETRTCTSMNNFIHICSKCKSKDNIKNTLKDIFSIFNKKDD